MKQEEMMKKVKSPSNLKNQAQSRNNLKEQAQSLPNPLNLENKTVSKKRNHSSKNNIAPPQIKEFLMVNRWPSV
jgi:hypothetical protein